MFKDAFTKFFKVNNKDIDFIMFASTQFVPGCFSGVDVGRLVYSLIYALTVLVSNI